MSLVLHLEGLLLFFRRQIACGWHPTYHGVVAGGRCHIISADIANIENVLGAAISYSDQVLYSPSDLLFIWWIFYQGVPR